MALILKEGAKQPPRRMAATLELAAMVRDARPRVRYGGLLTMRMR